MRKYLLLAFSLLTISACTSKKEEVSEKETTNTLDANRITLTAAQKKHSAIELVQLSTTSLPSTMQLNARTEVTPQDKVSITNMMGGFVKSIHVIPGNAVKKGQIIAVLEDPAYVQIQEDYLTTKALITKASAEYNRQKDLNESQAASTKVLEEARTELNLLQIKKRALEQKLQLIQLSPVHVSLQNMRRSLTIVSPVSGVVNDVFVNRGQYVSGSQPIVDLVQTGTPMLNIKAFENNLQYISVGQELEAYTNHSAEEKITAKVVAISQQVDEDGSVDVLAKVSNSNNIHLTANMYLNVTLSYESKSSTVLPEEAVVHFEGKDYVFQWIEKNTYQLKVVTIGRKANGKVEVTSSLDASQQYVGKGAYALLMAMKNSTEEE